MKLAVLVVLCGLLSGCKGPKGDQGAQGARGQTGLPATFTEFNGTIVFDPQTVSVGAISANTVVTCYFAPASFPTQFIELGTSSNPSTEEWAAVDYSNGNVSLFRLLSGDKYKIVVARPAAPMPSQQFGDRLLW